MKKGLPFLFAIVGTLLAALGVWAQSAAPLVGIDDANIFFVYAQNVVAGHGFVYFPGSGHVEGFSSLLWEFLCIVAFKFSAQPERTLFIINCVLVSLALASLAYFVRSLYVTSEWGSVAVVTFFAWVFSNPSFFSWTTLSLMESGVWSAINIFLSITLLYLISPARSLTPFGKLFVSALFALVILARPEGFLVGAAYLVLLGLVFWARENNGKTALGSIAPIAVAYFGVYASQLLWRLWYFGYPFPNTYYAKVASDVVYRITNGSYYFGKLLFWYPLSLLTVAAIGVGIWISIRLWFKRVLFTPELREPLLQFGISSAIVGMFFALPILEGGDHFPEARLYMPLWPLFFLPIVTAFRLVFDIQIRKMLATHRMVVVWAAVCTGCVVMGIYMPPYRWMSFPERFNISREMQFAESLRRDGRFLNEFFDTGRLPSVGATAVGGVALTYQGEIVDLLGLNSVAMAHAKSNDKKGLTGHAAFDKQTFYTLNVDVVMPKVVEAQTTVSGAVDSLSYTNTAILKGILNDQEFLAKYQPAIIFNPRTNQYLFGYYSRSLITELRGAKMRITTLPQR